MGKIAPLLQAVTEGGQFWRTGFRRQNRCVVFSRGAREFSTKKRDGDLEMFFDWHFRACISDNRNCESRHNHINFSSTASAGDKSRLFCRNALATILARP